MGATSCAFVGGSRGCWQAVSVLGGMIRVLSESPLGPAHRAQGRDRDLSFPSVEVGAVIGRGRTGEDANSEHPGAEMSMLFRGTRRLGGGWPRRYRGNGSRVDGIVFDIFDLWCDR